MSDRRKTKEQLIAELVDARRRIAELQREVEEPADAEERRGAQQQQQMRRLATVVRDSNDAIVVQDFEGQILAWNRGSELMYGYSEDEALQMSIWRLTPPDREAEQKEFTRRLVAGEAVSSFETQRVTKDGRILDVWLTVTKLTDDTGKPIGIASTEHDITERKRAEEALHNSERLYRSLVEHLPQRIFIKDRNLLYVSCNINYAQDLGIVPEQIVGKDDFAFYPRELAESYRADDQAVMEAGTLKDIEERYQVAGEARWVHTVKVPYHDEQGRVIGVLGVFDDITERRQAEAEREKLEEQFRQSQKLEAVGRLAGGIAHDFNNLLTGIMGFADFAREEAEPGSQAHADLTEVVALADRAANLTRQLLAFGRQQALEPVVLNVNQLLADQTTMLTRLLGEDIDVRFMPAPDLGNVRADPGQIEQVIMNLAVNARDAMPDGGRLTIETANVELGAEYARNHTDVTPGSYVMIAVSDTGCGMDENTQQRTFEPFFTTKEQGKGTGLGLSTVYGIVKQHGGSIYVYSEAGKGATFRTYLPRVVAEAQERSPPSEFVTGGSETILLVEDDEAVRDVGRRHLEELGYAVLCASNAREAEEVAAKHGGRIDLLLTDVVMPDRNGRELYESLAAKQAGLKVLFMSGYTDNAIVHHGVLEEGIPFLQKPFERDSLAAKVREALGR